MILNFLLKFFLLQSGGFFFHIYAFCFPGTSHIRRDSCMMHLLLLNRDTFFCVLFCVLLLYLMPCFCRLLFFTHLICWKNIFFNVFCDIFLFFFKKILAELILPAVSSCFECIICQEPGCVHNTLRKPCISFYYLQCFDCRCNSLLLAK